MSVNVGSAIGYLDLDTSGFTGGLRTALSDLRGFTSQSTKLTDKVAAVGGAMKSAGSTLAKTFTVPLAAAGAAAVKTAADFEAGMSEVSAISGASGKDLEALSAKAKEMGATTKFSASESAEALKYMAMAGWDTEDMLNGLEGVMNLAAASGEDLATTSDIVTDALTAFGLSAKDSNHFADILARASSRANTNVGMMGETFKYVAPVAGALGYKAEDVAVGIGLMANSGIKASQAGTALRSALSRMAKPTKQAYNAMTQLGISFTNADGSMRSFDGLMRHLRERFAGLTEAQQAQYAAMLFGQEAMSGMLAIMNTSEEDYDKLTLEILDCNGAAKEMADTMNDNLAGQLTILKSTLEGIAIAFGELLLPMVKKVVDKLQDFATFISNLDDKQKKLATRIATVVAALGPALLISGKLITSGTKLYNTLGKGLSVITKTENGWGTLFKTLKAHPYALLAAGIGLATVAIGKQIAKLHENERAAKDLAEANEAEVAQIENSADTAERYLTQLEDLMSVEYKSGQQKDAIKRYVDLLNESVEGLNLEYDEEADKLNETTKAIEKKIEARKKEQLAEAYLAQSKKALEEYAAVQLQITDVEAESAAAKQEQARILEQVGESAGKMDIRYKELQKTIQSNDRELADLTKSSQLYTQEAQRASNMAEIESGSFDKLAKKAEKAGVEIPESLITGIKNGSYALPQTVEEVQQLIKFDKAVQRAGTQGADLVQQLQAQIRSGEISVKDATQTLTQATKDGFSEAPSNAATVGKDVKNKYAEAIKAGAGMVQTAGKDLAKAADKGLSKHSAKSKGKALGKAFADGIRSAADAIRAAASAVAAAVSAALNSATSSATSAGKKSGTKGISAPSGGLVIPAGSYAKGLSYVPYNGFPAVLHKGERVLTKTEARAYNESELRAANGGYTFNFYSPQELSPAEQARQFKKTMNQILFNM